MQLQEAEADSLKAVETMTMAAEHVAKFCGVWATVRPGLEILAELLPTPGPLIIKALLKVGDAVAKKNDCPA